MAQVALLASTVSSKMLRAVAEAEGCECSCLLHWALRAAARRSVRRDIDRLQVARSEGKRTAVPSKWAVCHYCVLVAHGGRVECVAPCGRDMM